MSLNASFTRPTSAGASASESSTLLAHPSVSTTANTTISNTAHTLMFDPTNGGLSTAVAWWKVLGAVLGAIGAIAALVLTVCQIRLARRKLYSREESVSSA